ncbi:helicase HerA domain-containing protein [Amycolatopsis sp. NPDC059027]|uniref:helicase HerA domain-containing protein n=1 Tax=Amycolatopsis sp. NPDC059027 TaxID=3346709 RepID=UPI003672CF29
MPETVPWAQLGPAFLHEWGWPEGKWTAEHLAVLGPTGSGKSRFMTTVVDERARASGAHAVILATKPADSTMKALQGKGWKLRRTWPPDYGESRVIFWPPARSMTEGSAKQRKAVFDFLAELWQPDANIIVGFDEIAYVETELRLRPMIEQYWREARALGITTVASTQRPRNVSRLMHSEPSWSVAFRPDDEDDAKRVAEILGSRRTFTPILLELERYYFLMVRRRTREAYISRLP